MVKIKFCGITNRADAMEAARLNAEMVGFVFYKKSRRNVDAETAREIGKALPPFVARVGVFVDEKKEVVLKAAEECGLDMLQFHGDETPRYCDRFKRRFKTIKAIRVRGKASLAKINRYSTDYYLLDAYQRGKPGGTGKTFDWSALEGARFRRPVILSGGLSPSNVVEAIERIRPYGVDVSSGVENTPGKKDRAKMRKFVEEIRKRGL
jgi:phosphoribosylanthranilate isomerase